MNKVIIYTRVSTGKQVESGLSLLSQETRCRAYCTARGLGVHAVIVEEGVSAGKPLATRPGGLSMLDMLATGVASGVVALKLDRLFRDVVDCLVTVTGFDKKNISFHLVDFGGNSINTGSAIGKMFITQLAGFAEFERNLTSERTKAALSIKKEKGEVVGHIPFGKKRGEDGVILIECKEEIEIIDLIKAFKELGMSVPEMRQRLNHYKYSLNRGKSWTKSALYRLMERERIQ